jgi:hypothetical protein
VTEPWKETVRGVEDLLRSSTAGTTGGVGGAEGIDLGTPLEILSCGEASAPREGDLVLGVAAAEGTLDGGLEVC